MSILFSGDFHANAVNEIANISMNALRRKYRLENYKNINYHIILGDGGFLWPRNERTDTFNNKILALRPFPILCVMGNHEPVYGRPDLPEVDIGIGEKVILVNKKSPFIAYLKRGKAYTIENRKFLVLGGALSIDKEYRVPGISWWENEYWSDPEKEELFSFLKKNRKFDYVLSHTGPSRVNETLFSSKNMGFHPKFFDHVAALNEMIDGKISCRQWFCGHWHKDVYHYDENLKRGYQYLYNKTALLRDEDIIVR